MRYAPTCLWRVTACVALAAAIALNGGCSAQGPGSELGPEARTTSLHGKLHLAGSTVVAPLLVDIAHRYEQEHPGVQIIVDTTRSSHGMKNVRDGTIDIGMASRALTDQEKDLIGFSVARD